MKNKESGTSKSLIFTRETFGMALLLFSAIVLLAICTGDVVFAGFGTAICHFMYGTFGYGSFFVVALFACLGVWLTFEKRIKLKVRPALFLSLTVYMLFLLFHAVSTRNFDINGSYIGACYDAAATAEFSSYTFGGVLSAILVYPVVSVVDFIGAYIIFSLLTVLCGYFTVQSFRKHYGKKSARATSKSAESNVSAEAAVQPEVPAPVPVMADQNYTGEEAPQYAQPQYDQQQYGQYDQSQYAQPQYEQQQYGQPYDGYQTPAQGYSQQGGYESDNSAPMSQTYVDPYGEYLRNQAAYQQALSSSPSSSEDKYAPENLGRQIIFDRDEFAAESYRRNGIFDENSYFNQPIKSAGSGSGYTSSFTSSKPQPAATIQPVYTNKTSGTATGGGSAAPQPVKQTPSTYTAAYQKSVEEQVSPSAPGIIYGDMPVLKLEDDAVPYTAPDDKDFDFNSDSSEGDSHSAYDSYDSADYGAPETDIDQRDELTGGNEYAEFSDDIAGNAPRSTDGRDSSADADRRLDGMLFGSGERKSDDFGFPTRRGDDSFGLRGSTSGEERRIADDFSDISAPRQSEEPDRKIVGFGEPSEGTPRRDESPSDNGGADERFGDISRGRDGSSDIFRPRGEGASDGGTRSGSLSSLFSSSNSRLGESRIEPDRSRLSQPRQSNANLFDDNSADRLHGGRMAADGGSDSHGLPSVEPIVPVVRGDSAAEVPQSNAAEDKKPPHVWKKYVRPSLELLDDYPEYNAADTAEIEESKKIIVETLEGFRIGCEISDVVVGPAITRYDVIILDRTNIKSSLRYRESIAMALKKENVNAYLNYSKGALSIEVPNAKRSVVGLKTMMRSTAYTNAKANSLTFALGKNVEGACICPDITKMPHLLVAGTTGSGKSICLSSLLISLLYKYGPEELRFILVDPKQVEFISYDKLPHLMINEIIYDVDKAIKALNWAIKEMERRYSLFKDMTESGANAKGGLKVATKDINEYNSHLEEGQEKLPKIVIVLDEFGDLMLQAKKDIESRIIKLVQKARAAGIHLILATQRPSVDCITGLIKSNLPTRIGFKVGSFDDSRTIFDVGGAEKLLGKGDMYFRSAERPELMRIQGCFVDTPEVQRVTDFIKQHNETYFDQSVSDFINKVEEPEQASGLSDGADNSEETKIDDTFIKALKYCVMSNAASVSMIQRRFPIGYIKACKIVDWMENMNYITKSEGSKSRKVLLSQEEFFNTYGDVDD